MRIQLRDLPRPTAASPPGGPARAVRAQPARSDARDRAFLLTTLHWDQARALTGRGRPDFGVRLKRRDPLSVRARVRLLAAVTTFGTFPYAEEQAEAVSAA